MIKQARANEKNEYLLKNLSCFTSQVDGCICYRLIFADVYSGEWICYVSPSNRNFGYWKDYLRKGFCLTNLRVLDYDKRLINADSYPKVSRYPDNDIKTIENRKVLEQPTLFNIS
jgi:hypothetical protein